MNLNVFCGAKGVDILIRWLFVQIRQSLLTRRRRGALKKRFGRPHGSRPRLLRPVVHGVAGHGGRDAHRASLPVTRAARRALRLPHWRMPQHNVAPNE